MEAYSPSVSPPSGVRQSLRKFGHEDRDEIKRRAEADFANLFADLGGRFRGKALHCILHDDRTPSASFRNGRFRCFSCDISLDLIELVQRVQRIDFKSALAFLGERYGVPVQSWRLPPAQRTQYASQQRDLERDLPDARRWQRSAVLFTEIRLDQLKARLADPKCSNVEWQEIPRVEQDLARLRRLTGPAIVEEYNAYRKKYPLLTSAMVRCIVRLEHIEERALAGYWNAMEARS